MTTQVNPDPIEVTVTCKMTLSPECLTNTPTYPAGWAKEIVAAASHDAASEIGQNWIDYINTLPWPEGCTFDILPSASQGVHVVVSGGAEIHYTNE